MRDVAGNIRATHKAQLELLVRELEARNDVLEADLGKLDARARALLPRVEEKLAAFEKLAAVSVAAAAPAASAAAGAAP
jgi:hypothetical protein